MPIPSKECLPAVPTAEPMGQREGRAARLRSFNIKDRLKKTAKPAAEQVPQKAEAGSGPVTQEEVETWGVRLRFSPLTEEQKAVIARLEKFRSPKQAERQAKRQRLSESSEAGIEAALAEGRLKLEDLSDPVAEKDTYPLIDGGQSESAPAMDLAMFEALKDRARKEFFNQGFAEALSTRDKNFVRRQLAAERLLEEKIISEDVKQVAQVLMSRLETISRHFKDLETAEKNKAYSAFITDICILNQCLVEPHVVSKLLELPHAQAIDFLARAYRNEIQSDSKYYWDNPYGSDREQSEMLDFLNGSGTNVYYLGDHGLSRISLSSGGGKQTYSVTFNSMTNVFAAWNVYGFPRKQKDFDQ